MKKKTADQEKRAVRCYKAKQTHYVNASARARKEGGTLTNLLENVVIGYGEGLEVQLVTKEQEVVRTTRKNLVIVTKANKC